MEEFQKKLLIGLIKGAAIAIVLILIIGRLKGEI